MQQTIKSNMSQASNAILLVKDQQASEKQALQCCTVFLSFFSTPAEILTYSWLDSQCLARCLAWRILNKCLPKRWTFQGSWKLPVSYSSPSGGDIRERPWRRLPWRRVKSWQARTSLVVQWLGLRLPAQGVWVQSLVGELGPTCFATKGPRQKAEAIL